VYKRQDIDSVFNRDTVANIWQAMPDDPPPALTHAQKLMNRHSPLSLCCTTVLIQKVRMADSIASALMHEFRFTARAMEHGDFLEGIRAAIIDRDRAPKWRHNSWRDVTGADVVAMGYPVNPPLHLGDPS